MSQLRFHSSSSVIPQEFSDDIPIVRQLVGIYKIWHRGLPHLPRLSRYTLGEKIDSLFCDTLELILEAGYAPREKKLIVINLASTKLDALKFFLRVAWELKVIDTKKYSQLAESLIEVGKMLGGWKKQLNKNNPPVDDRWNST